MITAKIYEADDKVINIIRDDYSILQLLGVFGINMGFGDKTVKEVCESQGVDTYTFITVVNFYINGTLAADSVSKLSVPTLLSYLRKSHAYYLEFELPHIRQELVGALDNDDNLATLILRLYDNYAHSIKGHMAYEEKTVFPYVEKLILGNVPANASTETFSKHHGQTDAKLRELKNIIIKYLPTDTLRNNRLLSALSHIYSTEKWLTQHVEVEEQIFLPAIRQLEEKCRQKDMSQRIAGMIGGDNQETLSDREKEVIMGVVQGMSNKEIADHLSIALNTVITHRRNIAKKLQIHTPAGLTIYAIVNNMIDISTVKL